MFSHPHDLHDDSTSRVVLVGTCLRSSCLWIVHPQLYHFSCSVRPCFCLPCLRYKSKVRINQVYRVENVISMDRNTLTFGLPLGLTIRVMTHSLQEKIGNINVWYVCM